jgi:hypothetical protein
MMLSVSRLHSANDRMTDKLEGGGHGIINVLSRHLPGGMEEKHENSQNSQYPGQDSNQASPECYCYRNMPGQILLC